MKGKGQKGKGTSKTDTEEAPQDKTRFSIMLGLTLGLLLASLDQTVVGTSMPKIVADLGGLDRFSWLFSGYMLAATCMIPLAGKMSDRYGRKPVFMIGMAMFLGGSMLGGLAQNMDQLIAFRVMQGFGGGSMLPVAIATVADLYPPTERGKIQGALGAVFSVSSIIGPFLGGWIVDHSTWRWVFYVNVPVGLCAMAVTMVKFPKLTVETTKPIDYLGMATLSTALSAGLFITFWGGDKYAWGSREIIGLVVLCVASLVAFVLIETKAKDPVLPLHMFRISIFTFGCLGLMFMAMGMFAVVAFLPMFLQAVIGFTATYSGEVLIPLMLTAMLGAIISGNALKYTGYKVWFFVGPLIAAGGLYLLSTLHSGSSWTSAVVYLAIAGLGLGLVMSVYIVATQNVVDKKEIGVATATMSLFRAMGGTIGVTIMGVVVNRRMDYELEHNLSPAAMSLLPSKDINTLGGILLSDAASVMPAEVVNGIRDSLGNSITYMFFICTFVVLIGWLFSLCIKSVPLKSKEEYLNGKPPKGKPDKEDPAAAPRSKTTTEEPAKTGVDGKGPPLPDGSTSRK